MIKWSKETKKECDNPFAISMFFPLFPYLFPRALKYGKHSLLLQAETCDEAQNKKGIANKTIIELWDILSLRIQIGQS